jgi:4-amino-4-deoxy-L-arabinose transferase-like glycosyltransferase
VSQTGDRVSDPPSATRLLRVLWPAALLLTVLRIPSFFEPHWYTDEAGYLITAREMLAGKVLYVQIWNNKPPLHFLTVALLYRIFGINEAWLHLATLLTALAVLTAVAYVGVRLLSLWRTVAATLITAVTIGLPNLDGQLLIPENLLIVPTTWAGAILLTRLTRDRLRPPEIRWWPLAVGVLAGVAIGYQQTAIADASAFALIIALAAPRPLRPLLLYAGSVAAVTALWLIPSLIMAGPGHVAYALIGNYISSTGDAIGKSGHSFHGLELELVAAAALIVLGAAGLRRVPIICWAPWVWAGATGLIAAAAQVPFAHYIIPAMAPAALAVASVQLPRIRPRAIRVGGATCLVIGLLLTSRLAAVVGHDWTISEGRRWLNHYYRGFAAVAFQRQSLTTWQNAFDARVRSDRGIVAYVDAHSLQRPNTVVFSSDAWPYLEANIPLSLRAGPIYVDNHLYANLPQHVENMNPQVIVVCWWDVWGHPPMGKILRARYHMVYSYGVDRVWVRDGSSVSG